MGLRRETVEMKRAKHTVTVWAEKRREGEEVSGTKKKQKNTKARAMDRGTSKGDGKQCHPLSACPAHSWGRFKGVRSEGRGSLFPPSILKSSFLVSRFMRRLRHHA